MAGVDFDGGILELLDLIEEHRDGLAYDWRSRFGSGLAELPGSIDWSEARSLIRTLGSDPSSFFFASLQGMEHPVTREGIVLMDLVDVVLKALDRRAKPYPRPWRKVLGRKVADTSDFTQDAVKALLARHRNGTDN